MKRVITLIFVALILSSFVLAQASENNIPPKINNVENTLEREITLPDYLSMPARIIFGIKGEIPIDTFIVLIAIWIILFLFIQSILQLTPIFKGAFSWPAGAIVTLLIAITGAIRTGAEYLLFIKSLLKFTENGFVIIAIVMTLLIIFFLIINTLLLAPLKKYFVRESAKLEGQTVGKEIGMISALRKTFNLYRKP